MTIYQAVHLPNIERIADAARRKVLCRFQGDAVRSPEATPAEFIAKWRHAFKGERVTLRVCCDGIGVADHVSLTERASSQTHFNDLSRLRPRRRRPVAMAGRTYGRMVSLGWEYKGKHKDLNAAYIQLLMYQGALENPPLLVTYDTDRIVIHTILTVITAPRGKWREPR